MSKRRGAPKGKTNAPPISIKFHASDEQLEDFLGEEPPEDEVAGPGGPQDASPPASDPWRFFSDIRGKITKSVEEKITEIKSRGQEEGSPKSRGAPGGRESDSEDLSESSLSRTCGAASTTEGVEMSSDEDGPPVSPLDGSRRTSDGSTGSGLRHRFRFMRKIRDNRDRSVEEGTVAARHLADIRRLQEEGDIESGVEALEEGDEDLRAVSEAVRNFETGDGGKVLLVEEVSGEEVREEYFKDCLEEGEGQERRTVFAPGGFVDLRPRAAGAEGSRSVSNYLYFLTVALWASLYLIIHYVSPYCGGLITGIVLAYLLFRLRHKLDRKPDEVPSTTGHSTTTAHRTGRILEVRAVTEYQPLQKYEGWVNEYPDSYSPDTYHVTHSQSVFLRLQGNLLRVSHSRNKVPKRAMWNEPDIVPVFTQHRIYNLLGGNVTLSPKGLTRKRLWSKKYPICVTLVKEQMCFDSDVLSKQESEDEKPAGMDKEKIPRKSLGRFRKKEYPSMAQRFSKLTEDDAGGGAGFDLDSDSRASTPSIDTSDVAEPPQPVDDPDLSTNEEEPPPPGCYPEETGCPVVKEPDDDPDEIRLYLFGRTDREKEDWYRRLRTATRRGQEETVCLDESDYLKYMSAFKVPDGGPSGSNPDRLTWLNSLLGRVLFDCIRDPDTVRSIRRRIQRKLGTIKLPYFIEELLVPELVLGTTTPVVKRTGSPVVDERGLWIDMDVEYEGSVVLTLQTKLNLMRLKNPQAYERPPRDSALSAIYNSDVDDSAESSSDDDLIVTDQPPQPSQPDGQQQQQQSGSKKLIKMVDRLTESKFFQAATDNKYVKKAMEGVSNTDLRLTVELRSLTGTVVVNVPPPPSDRAWIGFRPVPDIRISARPIVGERHLSYMMVTGWIERKLLLEFQKIMVIPNMEDFVIPVMNPKLPE